MTNNRKHVRVSYEKQVELISEGQILVGKSIDISKSGIRVIVNVPVSHLAVHRIAFTLPFAPEAIHIPCKIVRSDSPGPEEDEHVLGIEFSNQTETQMVLIDNFIRDKKNSLMKSDDNQSELRVIPRIMCNLTGITCDNSEIYILSIDNISTEGCLISYRGALTAHEDLTLSIALPGDRRRITATGTITYVIQGGELGLHRAGLCFTALSDIDSIRIRNFILKSATSTAIRSMQERRDENLSGNENLIRDPEKIAGLFKILKKENRNINVLFEKSIVIFVLAMKNIDIQHTSFATSSQKEISDLDLKKQHPVYFSFYLNGSSYYFTSHIMEAGENRLIFAFPPVLYQSDKRSYERKYISEGIDVSLELDDQPSVKFVGTVVNISRRGFLCNVKLSSADQELVKRGNPVSYFFNRDIGLDSFGEIRHIKENRTENGETFFQMGIEAGIRRKSIRFKRYSLGLWNKGKGPAVNVAAGGGAAGLSEIVRYANREGKEITALLNHTGSCRNVPVVVLPPAFGKKKESLAPLVATLLENFVCSGRDIVTLRYDGINRPGESYKDDMCPKRGYEMLHYRISQGLDDLEATMDYIHNNDLFKPSAVIIVAFSMSALDARKLAVKDKRIAYVINVMGVTCARSSFSSITGGIDIIDNARNGIQNGLSGVLGQILNLDTVAEDLIENRYAYLADARHDMARINIPLSWIYGKYDRWVVEREIKDLMSVRAKGHREVIEIPTGHNLRSSEDAIKTFKIITGMIYRHLHGKRIRLADPDRERMVGMITYERERLSMPEEVNIREYWKEYLVGTDRNSAGYDVYRNIDEFREFLSLQGELLDLKNGESMADMGCGTGIFIERMLADKIGRKADLSRSSLVLVDLVPEALARTREKIERLKRCGSLIPERIIYMQQDLEPNRMLPVKRFMEDRTLGYDYLRNRVEGLKNTTIDNLIRLGSERINSIMRGETVIDGDRRILQECFSSDDILSILDFNRAARYVSENFKPDDINGPHTSTCMEPAPQGSRDISSGCMEFRKLHFGNKGGNLQLDFNDESFHKISASLLISYLFNADEIIFEFYRLLKPDGRLLVSSMRPDSDISIIFTNYINKVQTLVSDDNSSDKREIDLADARTMLNEASSLLQLEEDGYFRFYSGDEIAGMMKKAGFENIEIRVSMGNPPQAVIVTGTKNKTDR